MYRDIVLLVLPWFWIALATAVAVVHRRGGPPAATWLAVALGTYGASCLFIGPASWPPWWLAAWQLLAAAGVWAAALRMPAGGSEA